MRIDVTQEDINKGGISAFRCPIARACQRATRMRAYVICEEVVIYRDTRDLSGRRFRLPPKACEFYHAFDNEEHVEPFSFDLVAPVVESKTQ